MPSTSPPTPPKLGPIPPWQTLPYHVLLSIMQYASYPLYTGASKDTGLMRWLLDTSELCRSFHDACIGAMMFDPPLFPPHRAHYLVDLLKASRYHFHGAPADRATGPTRSSIPPRPSLDYRSKIKALSIEVKNILVRKAGIQLEDLIRLTPLLKHLRLYHNHDSLSDKYIWATPGSDRSKVKWSYDGDNVFGLLDQNHIQLDSFEWNNRFLRDDPDLQSFKTHNLSSQCLRRLKSLTLRNFILSTAEKLIDHLAGETVTDAELATNEKALHLTSWRSTVLKVLNSFPELTDLTLHTCNIFDDTIIASLPSGLSSLTLANVPFVRSEGLAQYLSTSGGTLTSLILVGNQSLSLGFLSSLSTTTPHLQHIDVDLTYHDPTSFRDTEPLFDDLLPLGAPTWPTTLEHISIGPLRNLTSDDAESFFQSLVDAAPDLTLLRSLSLRTFLKEASWRDRATLRSKWDAKLHETFHVKSNAAVSAPSPVGDFDDQKKADVSRKSRRLNNLSQLPVGDAPSGNGRCHTVIFELSDQRPAQEQFKEADFLDSEPEGDVEWNERDDVDEAPKYSRRTYAW